MRHVRMLGLCFGAIFAVVAIAATSASALPEWGKCEKVGEKGGKYTDVNCTKKAKKNAAGEFLGEYEFRKAKEVSEKRVAEGKSKNVPFSGANVGSGGVLTSLIRFCTVPPEGFAHRLTRAKCKEEGGEEGQATEVIKIECESEHNTGEVLAPNKVQNVSVKFLGCKVFGSTPCSNGPNEGEIQVNPLKGQLGYINKAEKKVGILLEPAKKHGEFAKFNCGGSLGVVVGVGNSKEGAFYEPETTGGFDGIISPITPANTTTSEYTQVYTVNPTTGENIPSKFEGKHRELLEDYIFNPEMPQYSFDWSAAGEEITNTNVSEEAGEIKA